VPGPAPTASSAGPDPSALELLDAGLPATVRGVFTTRPGGVSGPPYDALNLSRRSGDRPAPVQANRERLAGELGVAPADLVFAEQVHGAGVAVVERADARTPEGVPGVDALLTRDRRLALVVLAADCLPVLLADPDAGVVAAVHAGRRGLVAGVLQAALRAMSALGAQPARTSAVIGPSAGGCCYEVPPAMVEQVARAVPGTAARTRAGSPSVDLRAGAQGLLHSAGVAAVRHVDACTLEDARFYSYRRDGATGRHAGVVLLP